METKNKIALITGGTHGIGAATAVMLAKEGADICLVARNTENLPLQRTIEKLGVRCLTVSADLSKEEDCQRAVTEAVAGLGGLDILVHSAGAAAPGSLISGAKEIWYHAFDVHIHAAYHLCVAAVPHMKSRKEGAIIFISSAAGLRGVKNAIAYAAVKGAVPQLTRALAFELSDYNIRVNCVSPGVIRTRFQEYLTDEQVKNNTDNRIPLHREGTPEDVAEAISMLIRNNFITGENVVIDGGMTMRIV